MWILPIFAFLALPVAPAVGVALPPAIRTTLDQEYSGWKFAPVNTQIQQTFKKHHTNRLPSFTGGDFDHDGKKDYVVQIALTTPGQEEQIVIVFLARGDHYEETILQSMGLDQTVYLWVAQRPLAETGSNAQETLVKKDVLMVLGGPAGDTTYAYEEGKFQEVTTPEDPERQDSDIPRAPVPL